MHLLLVMPCALPSLDENTRTSPPARNRRRPGTRARANRAQPPTGSRPADRCERCRRSRNRREDIAGGLHRLGIASRGQANPVRKNCGRLVARKMSVGVSGRLNQAPAAWPMKLVASTKHRAERKQLQRIAERREAIEARQHDEIERERRQIDGQVRDAAAEHARECVPPPPAPARRRSASIAPISSVCCRISTKAAGTM